MERDNGRGQDHSTKRSQAISGQDGKRPKGKEPGHMRECGRQMLKSNEGTERRNESPGGKANRAGRMQSPEQGTEWDRKYKKYIY